MSAIEERFTHNLHEYERSSENKDIYRCIHPRCNHYHRRAYLVGKAATCPKCKNEFVLTYKQLRNKLPVCDLCTKSPKAEVLRAARDAAFKALNDLPDEFKQELLNKTLE